MCNCLNFINFFRHKSIIELTPRKLGAGVLDIKWENASVLWSGGYDSYLRKWDLRTGKCIQALGDPFGATVNCFEYDYYNSIISGTHSNGRAVLWDSRKDHYVQVGRII